MSNLTNIQSYFIFSDQVHNKKNKKAKGNSSDSESSDSDSSDSDISDINLGLGASESESSDYDDFNPFGYGSDSDDGKSLVYIFSNSDNSIYGYHVYFSSFIKYLPYVSELLEYYYKATPFMLIVVWISLNVHQTQSIIWVCLRLFTLQLEMHVHSSFPDPWLKKYKNKGKEKEKKKKDQLNKKKKKDKDIDEKFDKALAAAGLLSKKNVGGTTAPVKENGQSTPSWNTSEKHFNDLHLQECGCDSMSYIYYWLVL